MKYNELKENLLKNDEVKAEYELLQPEYQVVRSMIIAREEKNISQQELADITGINRADLSRIENANANPSLKTLKRIANGLGKKLVISFV